MESYNIRHERLGNRDITVITHHSRGRAVQVRTYAWRAIKNSLRLAPLLVLVGCSHQGVDWDNVYYEEGTYAGAQSMTSVVGGR